MLSLIFLVGSFPLSLSTKKRGRLSSLVAQQVKDLVTRVAQVRSLAWQFPRAVGMANK